MSIVAGLMGAASALQSANTLITAVKQMSKPDNADEKATGQTKFADLLSEQLNKRRINIADNKAVQLSQRYMKLRDESGDNVLSLKESGLSTDMFAELDKDKNKCLDETELTALFR